jgi:hypothetical protein
MSVETQEPMFVEKPKVEEVVTAPPVKIKKPRKPMSEERKEILREQLKKAREIKKAKKEQKNTVERPATPMPAPIAPTPVAPEIKLEVVPNEVGGHSIPVEKVKKPRKPRVKKERNQLPKIDESIELKRQLDELRAANKSKENELLKQQIANQKLKNAQDKPIKLKKVTTKPLTTTETDSAPPPVEKKKARYSTYKKSVWAEYGV